MNWDAMMVCGAKRAMGNTTANKPINPYKPDANAWLDGWADVLDVINSHSQVPAITFTLCRLMAASDATRDGQHSMWAHHEGQDLSTSTLRSYSDLIVSSSTASA